MTEIPEHLRKRAAEARLKAAGAGPHYSDSTVGSSAPRSVYTQAQLDDAIANAFAEGQLKERADAAGNAPKIGNFPASVVSAVLEELDRVVDEKVRAGRKNLVEFGIEQDSVRNLGFGWFIVWLLHGVTVATVVASVSSAWLGLLAGAWTLAGLWAIGKWKSRRALGRAVDWTKIEITRQATGVDDVLD